MMEPLSEALRLLKRQTEIERRSRQRDGISIVEERELFTIRSKLPEFPAAVRVILEVAAAKRQSVEELRLEDVDHFGCER